MQPYSYVNEFSLFTEFLHYRNTVGAGHAAYRDSQRPGFGESKPLQKPLSKIERGAVLVRQVDLNEFVGVVVEAWEYDVSTATVFHCVIEAKF